MEPPPTDAAAGLSVRPARMADADVIARYNIDLALESENITLDPAVIGPGVRAALADPSKALYFVAESGGRVVGQLMITREWSDWRNGDIWWLQSVFVDLGFRRRGVFRSLYRHMEAQARAAGAVGLRLYVEKHNGVARETYRSLGLNDSPYLVMETMFGRRGGD